MKKFSYFLIVLFLYLQSSLINAEIVIDGKLDEDEWKEARQITSFYEVFPYTLNPVEDIKTVILVQESSEGIFLGFKNYQSNESMRSQSHQRDNERSIADKNGVTIDFDADKLSGYQFFVSSSGSIGDATYSNENERSYDWDADWLSAASTEDGVWYSEMFIPWTVAPMKAQSGEKRKVRMAFYRMLAGPQRVIATIKGSSYENLYLSVFNDYEFKNYQSSSIDFFPYLTINEDRIKGEVDNKVGAEVFWKIDSSKQLNAAFNPDFGQVESDELVVNFSAYETYYSDKRPFFAENQSLFNIQGYETFYVINTRRIGAAPDYNCSNLSGLNADLCNQTQIGTSDIDFALRYIEQTENLDIGFLGASEADENFSQGRDFYALRLRKNSENLTLGYLGTYVERPVLDREAAVHASDFEYRPNQDVRVNGAFLNSRINDENGYGFRVGYLRTPSKSFSTGAGIYYFDDTIDLSDMGYLWKNDYLMVTGRTQFKNADLPSSSFSRERNYTLDYALMTDTDWNKEPSSLSMTLDNGFKNFTDLKLKTFYRTSGRDNQITRKYKDSPYINMPKGYGYEVNYMNMSGKKYKYMAGFMRRKGEEYMSALGWNKAYDFLFEYTPADSISYSIFYQDLREKNWLNWLENNLLGTYEKRQRLTVAGINWFKGDKHELRLKAQMVAFTARTPKAYLANNLGDLMSADIPLPPITLSDLAFQIRYRYEIKPLSYFYLVYTKGGQVVQYDDEDNLGEIYQRPWDDPQTDTFTVKLRYRF